MGLCVTSHRLQEEVSLVRVEGITCLWAQQIRSHCIAMSLHQNSSSRFSPRPETFLVSGSCSFLQYVWGPSHGVGLKCNQKVVGYSPNVCATTVPIHIAGTWVIYPSCFRLLNAGTTGIHNSVLPDKIFYSPGWPWTLYVAKNGFKLLILLSLL